MSKEKTFMEKVLPEHSCPECKHYHKAPGEDPCLECIARWTDDPASKWESKN